MLFQLLIVPLRKDINSWVKNKSHKECYKQPWSIIIVWFIHTQPLQQAIIKYENLNLSQERSTLINLNPGQRKVFLQPQCFSVILFLLLHDTARSFRVNQHKPQWERGGPGRQRKVKTPALGATRREEDILLSSLRGSFRLETPSMLCIILAYLFCNNLVARYWKVIELCLV